MINHAVKNGEHDLLRQILSGNGPRDEGFEYLASRMINFLFL